MVHVAVYRPKEKTVAVKIIDLDRFERNQIDELRVRSAFVILCRRKFK